MQLTEEKGQHKVVGKDLKNYSAIKYVTRNYQFTKKKTDRIK